MFRKRSVWRSLIAGALIGVAEATRVDPAGRHRRPLGIVWLDDRDLPDPMVGIPLLLLDPVRLGDPGDSDVRRRRVGGVRLSLASPVGLLQRLGVPGWARARPEGGALRGLRPGIGGSRRRTGW
ncbi:MAG: hypothetical protein GWN02_11350 [Gemmatimonadetes bacterium]|nr:hypothetical protein [Gemmatimonadota bacterium]